MKKIQWAAGIILAFSVIIILLISSFETAMYSDFGVYEREYEKYDVLDDLGMTMEDTMHVTREMMAYLRGDRDVLSVETTVEGRQQDFFNEQDRFHMAEVRDLFIGGLDLRLGACAAHPDLSEGGLEKDRSQILLDRFGGDWRAPGGFCGCCGERLQCCVCWISSYLF